LERETGETRQSCNPKKETRNKKGNTQSRPPEKGELKTAGTKKKKGKRPFYDTRNTGEWKRRNRVKAMKKVGKGSPN